MASAVERSPRHLRELGRIAARWSSLDQVLAKLLAETLQDEAIAEAAYFTPMSQRARFDMVRTIINASQRPSQSEKLLIGNILDDLDALWLKRNEIMHNPIIAHYGPNGGPTMIIRITRPANRKRPRREMPLPVNLLKQHATKLDALAEQLFKIAYARELELLKEATKTPSSGDKSSRTRRRPDGVK